MVTWESKKASNDQILYYYIELWNYKIYLHIISTTHYKVCIYRQINSGECYTECLFKAKNLDDAKQQTLSILRSYFEGGMLALDEIEGME